MSNTAERNREQTTRRWAGQLTIVGVAAAVILTGCSDTEPRTTEPAAPSTSSPAPAAEPTQSEPNFHEHTVDVGGEQREFQVFAPNGYEQGEPRPLVVVLHAGRSSTEVIRSRSNMDDLARRQGFLVAYPQGLGGFWEPVVRGDHGVGVEFGGDPTDVEFIRLVVTQLVDEWNADPYQVFATGHSNGAAMSYRLAAEASDVFTAIAPVGGYVFDPPSSLEPTEPVSVVGFVGLGSKYTGEIAEGLEIWRDLLDCPRGEPEPATDDGRVTMTASTCRNGSEVVEYEIEGMGHVWPEEKHGIDATEAMWEYFTK